MSLTHESNRFAATDATERKALVSARLERLPVTRQVLWTRNIIGAATFFDGYTVIAIAYAMPVLVKEWGLAPEQTGYILSMGYLGQLFGGGSADLHALHARGLRALVGPVNERLHGVGSALHQRLDAAIAAVAHPAVQAQALGLLDGGVAVVHALHQAIHTQMAGQSG